MTISGEDAGFHRMKSTRSERAASRNSNTLVVLRFCGYYTILTASSRHAIVSRVDDVTRARCRLDLAERAHGHVKRIPARHTSLAQAKNA